MAAVLSVPVHLYREKSNNQHTTVALKLASRDSHHSPSRTVSHPSEKSTVSLLAKVLIYDSEPRLHAHSCEQHLHTLKVPTSATGEAQDV